jgi:hypothetical protein
VTRDAAPLIAADDDCVRIGFEQALRGRQPPFETARFGRCHGDSIDVEFFCELTMALSTWRQTGTTVMLVPSGARISFRSPRLRIESALARAQNLAGTRNQNASL